MDVVIVEDEGITVLFLEESLLQEGHTVLNSFDNAKDTLEYLEKSKIPELIFMDINIRGAIDGIELALKIKELYPQIAFVFLTSYKDKQTLQETKKAKPLGYLIKPVLKSSIDAIMMVVESQTTNKTQNKISNIVAINNYNYNKKSKIIYFQETPILLSQNETKCLDFFVKNLNSYISTQQLSYEIWDEERTLATVRELLFRLRKKLPHLAIKNVPNLGYILLPNEINFKQL